MSVAIFGYGVVGSAQASVLNSLGVEYVIHDPPQGRMLPVNNHGKFTNVDLAFVCVPAPTMDDGTVDATAIFNTLERLHDGSTAVIRSTILPGTTDSLQVCFPKLDIYFVPEFLTEATAVKDALEPKRLIIGYSDTLLAKLFNYLSGAESWPLEMRNVRDYFPEVGLVNWVPARDAEAAKYAANGFYALKVAFMNQMYEYVQACGGDWENVRSAIAIDPWTGRQHTDVHHGGYRGYAGKCLPKDAAALLHAAQEHGTPITTLQAAHTYNAKLVASQLL